MDNPGWLPRLRIRSTGEPCNAQVVLIGLDGTETDITDSGITSISWSLASHDIAEATITFEAVEIDAEIVERVAQVANVALSNGDH